MCIRKHSTGLSSVGSSFVRELRNGRPHTKKKAKMALEKTESRGAGHGGKSFIRFCWARWTSSQHNVSTKAYFVYQSTHIQTTQRVIPLFISAEYNLYIYIYVNVRMTRSMQNLLTNPRWVEPRTSRRWVSLSKEMLAVIVSFLAILCAIQQPRERLTIPQLRRLYLMRLSTNSRVFAPPNVDRATSRIPSIVHISRNTHKGRENRTAPTSLVLSRYTRTAL